MNITLKNGNAVRLSVKPIGRGGEGVVHSVQQGAGKGPRVGKLYKPEKRTKQQEEKINFLIANPPATADVASGHPYLIWPTAALYDDGDFAGLVMPRAEGVELETLCLGKLDSSLGFQWQRFAHGTADARRLRLSICRNLCHAVAALQRKKCYVLVDMKPVNVFVNEQGLVSIIDLDSVQVTERGHLLYAGKLCTPEYTPPEALRQEKIRQLSWDNFSLAVILYRLLVGLHPFAGSFHNQAITDVTGAIQHGLYPHGQQRAAFAVVPHPHRGLHDYPAVVADLFNRCFEAGIHQPDLRPSAEEWFLALHELLTAAPVITSFIVTPQVVNDASPVRIQWQVSNAISLKLSPYGEVTGKQDVSVRVTRDTMFTLEATSFTGHKTSQSFTVRTDQRPPDIKRFTAEPSTVLAGEPVRLSWVVDRAATIYVGDSPGQLLAQTASYIDCNPNSATRYIIRADSAFGVAAQSSCEVQVYPRPVLNGFGPAHAKIKPGQPTELRWSVQHYQKLLLRIDGSTRDVTGKTAFDIRPTRTSTYELEIIALDGRTRLAAQATVEVVPLVKIQRFTSDKVSTMASVIVRLSWQVSHAEQLILHPEGRDVTGQTYCDVSPGHSTIYELVARNAVSETRSIPLSIQVQGLPRFEGMTLPEIPRISLSPPPILGHWQTHDPTQARRLIFEEQVLPPAPVGASTWPVGNVYARLRKALGAAVNRMLSQSEKSDANA
ncbi:hypothetical protein HER32_16705 [Hymenobacter sp. BT18]|uniref:protein kinase domain-containing protein n=1 Tax=Hymenobacter sp. BT18 TaxID=2835648 RepID=UPI00143EF0A6|nr:hypothetical protein [Hymenobacter sp. BT18]QIX62723.1 hypothetical protein HER32_16705 [Hymenobacter sp. BT18]